MTIEECYEAIESDYKSVFKRFGNGAMVKRFAIKFLNDPSFNELKDGIENNDVEKAFRAAHTLKGICLRISALTSFSRSARHLQRSLETRISFRNVQICLRLLKSSIIFLLKTLKM